MDELFRREDIRLKTFQHFPVYFLDRNELAMSGMFYRGDLDRTKCYFCKIEIGRWEPGDEAVSEHLRWSPNCPLLRRRPTDNVPIDAERLDRLLPPARYDTCGVTDIEVRSNAIPEGSIPATHMPMSDVFATSAASGSSNSSSYMASACMIGSCYPEFPEFALEISRLTTFTDWPKHMKQRPEQLAEAGFFYTGVGDRVKCFSCGGGLKDWHEDDEPWELHAMWMSKCYFLKLIKGQSFIDSVTNKAKTTKVNTPALMKPTASKSMSLPVPSSLEAEEELEATAAMAIPGLQHTIKDNRKISSSVPEEKLCKICYANEYNTAFLPCGHVVACAKCASSVTKCPMCRKPFIDIMRVYFS